MKKERNNSHLLDQNNTSIVEQSKKFSSHASLFKGLGIESEGYSDEEIGNIVKHIFSMRKSIFWLLIILCLILMTICLLQIDKVLVLIKAISS